LYSNLQLTAKYLKYRLSALNGKGHGIHSPFVFDFVRNVCNNAGKKQPPPALQELRKELLHDRTELQVEDFGAGSRLQKQKLRSVRSLATSAVKPPKYASLLFRLCAHYRPGTVLELGTSLGLTTAYLSAANPDARIITIEGSTAIAERARDNFRKLGCRNIEQVCGSFDEVLPETLKTITSLDLAYIDGNHRYGPTLSYFNQLLPFLHDRSIVVFDDIHWSPEMERAWASVKEHNAVQYTIDLFFLGFVFFRKDFKVKQHFVIRY
jgi:predicted O-methyltransferase YrrM